MTPDRLTAADVARICGVDLKTIHNWANKGKIPCTRTEGRHLRFRRLEIIEFLRSYSFAVPDSLRHARPRVVIADAEAGLAAKRALGKRFEIDAYAGIVEALVAIGARDPDALVIDVPSADVTAIDALACVEALRASPKTRHVRIVVTSADEEARERALAAGAAAFVRKPVTPKLREILEELTGLTR